MIDVNAVYVSIQGEGAMTGVPMVVLRLMGCGVGCHFCDTKETWDKMSSRRVVGTDAECFDAVAVTKSHAFARFSERALASMIAHHWPHISWVLVTGGEPAEQPLVALVTELHGVLKQVAIETSGTARGHLSPRSSQSPLERSYDTHFDWVCVSPKIDNPAGLRVLPECIQTADELKFVIGKHADVARAARFVTEHTHYIGDRAQISVQPMSMSEGATRLCVDAALAHDWRLSLQAHKYAALP